MYQILLGSSLLYSPTAMDRTVYNAVLEEELNDAGLFTFTVPPTNPLYNSINEGVSKVTIVKDNKNIWYGFVTQTKVNLRLEKKVTCLGELALLNRTIQPPKRYQNKTPTQLFTSYLGYHNNGASDSDKFTVGEVTVTDPNDSVYRYTNRETTLTCLRDDLCDSLGGYLRIRHEGDTRYLDLVPLNEYGKLSNQTIRFGRNLLDYAKGISAEDIYTQVTPLGARLDTQTIVGLDDYLTIKSVNDNIDYLSNDSAVYTFGKRMAVINWDNVETPSILKAKGQAWLNEAQFSSMELELTAVDLSIIQSEFNSIDLGDRVRVICTPYGLDTTLPVQKKTTYLMQPDKNVITLSQTGKSTYTSSVQSQINNIEQGQPQVYSIAKQMIDLLAMQDRTSPALGDANDCTKNGIYHLNGNSANAPTTSPCEVLVLAFSNRIIQIAFRDTSTTATAFYVRRYYNSWGNWCTYTGTF